MVARRIAATASSRASPGVYEEHEPVTTPEELLDACMGLRKDAFFSFRGQRDKTWNLGLHHNADDDPKPRATNLSRRPDVRKDVIDPRMLDRFITQFRRRCMEFPQLDYVSEGDNLRWLLFAQHHRLRTSLLDWTKDPLVAMYFAVENIISGRSDESSCGAVWAIRVAKRRFIDATNTKDVRSLAREKHLVMINPPPITPRMIRQSSVFTYHKSKSEWSITDPRAMRYVERLVRIPIGSHASCSRLNAKITRGIREKLGIMNVHHGSLFPDPQGIAEFINNEWLSIGRDPADARKRNVQQ